MQFRVCSKCKIEKRLTTEFFAPQQRNKARFHTECRDCKLKYMRQWQASKTAGQEVDHKRKKHMYEIKIPTKEAIQERMEAAYKQIYLQAFHKELSDKELKKLMNDDS